MIRKTSLYNTKLQKNLGRKKSNYRNNNVHVFLYFISLFFIRYMYKWFFVVVDYTDLYLKGKQLHLDALYILIVLYCMLVNKVCNIWKR